MRARSPMDVGRARFGAARPGEGARRGAADARAPTYASVLRDPRMMLRPSRYALAMIS